MVKDPHQPKLPWYWRLMRALLLAPIILVVAGICLVLLVVVTPLGIVGVFLLAQFVAWLVRTIRRRRAMLILGYVEQAVRMNLPLSPMLDAAAASESGVLAYRLKALSYRLRCGEPLALALRVAMIDCGESIGRLRDAMRRIMKEYERDDTQHRDDTGMLRLYAFNVVLILITVLTAMMVFIVPKFEKIFEDFGTRLPPVTESLIKTSSWMAGNLYPDQMVPGITYLMLFLMAWVGYWFVQRIGPGRTFTGHLSWRIPGAHQVVRDRGMADLCHALTDAVRAGLPLKTAVEQAGVLEINPVLLSRVHCWLAAMTRGDTPHEAARSARLPNLLVHLLATARGRDDLIDVFQFLARYYSHRVYRSLIVLRNSVVPLTVVLLGIPVAWFALAMFTPLVRLMYQVNTGYWGAY